MGQPVIHWQIVTRQPEKLQQFYAEAYLVDRVEQLPAISLRWRNKVTALEQRNDGVLVSIATPEGSYALLAAYVIACDGAPLADPIWNAVGEEAGPPLPALRLDSPRSPSVPATAAA